MDLTLTAEDAALLKKILESHLSDLRMEIVSTEKFDWREEMKQDEEKIKALIARLG